MADTERAYYLERARRALELSEKAQDLSIASIHMEMYDRYMERADEYCFYVPGQTGTAAHHT